MLRARSVGVFASVLAVCAVLLFGCASIAYQDGYGTQYKIGPDKWIVYYEGTADMRESLVLDYALNRCAEVALNLGYGHYRVLGVQRGGTTSSYYIPGTETSVVSVDPDGGPFVTTRVIEGRTVSSSKDSYSVTIECFHEPAKGTLDAREVWAAFNAQQQATAGN